MALAPGSKLGQYETVALIGAGGMGEVYQARDTKLGRDVAIKVLPEQFAREPERLARFQREAKLLAALNHPNIATIHGLEQSGDTHYLVMELVPGQTLAERILSGAIPVDEALPIARQVADAVEYAHDKNVIHRDLKPANIKVTGEGMVKVLDFGLAKAMSEDPTDTDMSNSPTLSMAATRQGVILGTAAYMSPEQAKGKTVDRRTDIWAFGAVLYEMLTGKQAFQGGDVTEVLAAVVMKEPALDALPAKTPAAIRTLVRRCLEKNLKRRLVHIGEARIVLEDVLSGVATAEAVPAARGRRALGWIGAAVATALLLALAAVSFVHFRETPAEVPVLRATVLPPENTTLDFVSSLGLPAVSPDGRRLAFSAGPVGGTNQLYIRPLEALTAQPLAGTEGATFPFWSPDSRFVGFFAGGKLKKIDASGGPAITLADAPAGRGGSWSRDGVIVFGPLNSGPLQRVSASGGAASPATTQDTASSEGNHRMPWFLPDGQHFLYAVAGVGGLGGATSASVTIRIGSLMGTERDPLEGKIVAETNSHAIYSQGYLLFVREDALMAQPFDAQRMETTGEAVPVAEQIQRALGSGNAGVFSASESGLLAFQEGAGAGGGNRLTWFDRTGKQISVLGAPAAYGDLELSPDGQRASVSIPDQAGRARDIWVYDVARSLRTRFTFAPADELSSIWSPDGSRLIFNSRRKGHQDLYQKAASGAGVEEVLFEDNLDKTPRSWSPDGRSILYTSTGGAIGSDLFVVPLSGDRKPVPFVATQFTELYGQFSPAGRWIAYTSNESGRGEVYVAPFPGPGGKWQVSIGGGNWPRWRPDGTEIFYVAPDTSLMVAAVNGKGASFEVGAVRSLFETRAMTGLRYPYDVSADGQRFLINTLRDQTTTFAPITVVLNWTAGLKK
jgi:Tol biopolymer transport system component/tRNA A-37 threonylcarbamoyl transferase component Bud32